MLKIIWLRVKINNLDIRTFYKFLLNIKPRYICCQLNKLNNKKPTIRFSCAWSLQKLCYYIGRLRENSWYSSFNFLEAWQDQVSSTLFVVESGQTLPSILVPPTLDFFCWLLLRYVRKLNNVYNLCYNTVVLKKKLIKLLKITLLRSYLGKNWASMGHTQNQSQFLLWK